MDTTLHQGAAAPGPAAHNAAALLKGKGPASGGKLDLPADHQKTYRSDGAAAAAREADEFIAALTSTVSPAGVKHAIVLAACHDVIKPAAAYWLIQVLVLRHA